MFQLLMNTVLADVSAFLTAYLDNVSIFSNSWKDHLVHLDEVLSRLERAGLTVKVSKCRLGCLECQHLDHVIGEGWTNSKSQQMLARMPGMSVFGPYHW